MPISGAKPKPAGQARHRVKPVYEWTEVVDVPFTGAPKLPATNPYGERWHSWTRRWWKDISAMPHCALWSVADWSFAVQTAAVADRFHYGVLGAATELRNREKILGTTLDFRRDLRIRYVEPKPDAPVEVTLLDDYRDL